MAGQPGDGPLKIALVAGEASGDQLGGKLIRALRERVPDVSCFGVGGDHMRAAGFDAWWDRRELSVMGLFEVARHLPRLLRLRRALLGRLLEARPDVVVGIDAPDFNLGLEKRLKQQGLKTVHYVSPTVWAWREGRAAKIGAAADLVLCLFPFEPPFYANHGVRAAYTGHPMADAIDNDPDRASARRALGLAEDPEADGRPLVALLPGSRTSEVGRLAAPMLDAAERLAGRPGGARFVAALADESTAELFRASLANMRGIDCRIVTGRALDVMAASDVVVCASGTATLETLLVNRPMVVTYRLAASTYQMAKSFKLIKTRFIALPNILADEGLVPELIQDDASGENIAREVARWLDDATARERLRERFSAMHAELRCGAADRAAAAVLDLIRPEGND
ncbi:MAG: lipid-A-disaccharide synthase [Xanthomonadales bacterium]|jgi:lipid-A-disaccharide synthase|nr:lipid-A-disaccharide synthase [Xanthomonadales bacterium]